MIIKQFKCSHCKEFRFDLGFWIHDIITNHFLTLGGDYVCIGCGVKH